MDVKEIAAYLRKQNLKASLARVKVYEYLMNSKDHPTVDTIYSDLITTMPTLSKTTVYNILAVFEEKNIVEAILIEHNKIRYDIIGTRHGYFRCDHCHKIYEVPLKESIPFTLEGDFQIKNRHIYYTGICPECAKEKR